jgi:hypothetical protein
MDFAGLFTEEMVAHMGQEIELLAELLVLFAVGMSPPAGT